MCLMTFKAHSDIEPFFFQSDSGKIDYSKRVMILLSIVMSSCDILVILMGKILGCHSCVGTLNYLRRMLRNVRDSDI